VNLWLVLLIAASVTQDRTAPPNVTGQLDRTLPT